MGKLLSNHARGKILLCCNQDLIHIFARDSEVQQSVLSLLFRILIYIFRGLAERCDSPVHVCVCVSTVSKLIPVNSQKILMCHFFPVDLLALNIFFNER